MEDQDKLVYDFKQALGQTVFFYSQQLRQHLQDEAVDELLQSEIERVLTLFSSKRKSASLFSALSELRIEKEDDLLDAIQSKDMFRQMELEEELKSIRFVQSLLKEKTDAE